MTKGERRALYTAEKRLRLEGQNAERTPVCGNCAYFKRHYVKINGNFVLVPQGHCTNQRAKMRKETDWCDCYLLGPND